MSRMSMRSASIVAVLVALAVASACSRPDAEADATAPSWAGAPIAAPGTAPATKPKRSGTTDPSPTIPAAPPAFTRDQQDVADAYIAAVNAIREADTVPANPTNPSLGATMTGADLAYWTKQIGQDAAAGRGIRPGRTMLFRVEVLTVAVMGDTAVVRDCTVDDDVYYEASSGAIVNDAVSTALHEATIIREAITWKLATTRQVWKAEGVTTCPA